MLTEHAGNTCGLEQEALELVKYGAIPVDPVVDLVAASVSLQDAHVDKSAEFALDGPVTGAHEPHDLSQVERAVGVGEEKGQHGLAGLPKQGRAQRLEGRLTHVGARTHI